MVFNNQRLMGSLAIIVALPLGLFCVANGLSMLIAPVRWYWSVPGVPLTGGYNAHFIRDIGMVYAMTGAGVLLGLARTTQRRLLWGAASAWLTSHAVLHLLEVAAGLCGPEAIPRDFLGVTAPGLAALALALTPGRGRSAVTSPAPVSS